MWEEVVEMEEEEVVVEEDRGEAGGFEKGFLSRKKPLLPSSVLTMLK